MEQYIEWFRQVLDVSIRLYFRQECPVSSIYEIRCPDGGKLEKTLGIDSGALSFDEQVIIMLALIPHLCPQALDILFVNNKNFDRPYTEFGGRKGLSHGGFLPTGETAAFILAGESFEKRKDVCKLFDPEHRFRTANILRLDEQGKGEPFLSGKLEVFSSGYISTYNLSIWLNHYFNNMPPKHIIVMIN